MVAYKIWVLGARFESDIFDHKENLSVEQWKVIAGFDDMYYLVERLLNTPLTGV